MPKETIAVDLDDVLALHAAAFVQFSNEHYGTNLSEDDYDDTWANMWEGVPWEEIERRAIEFQTPERTLEYAKIDEAGVVLSYLKKRFHLAVVTARAQRLVPATHEWLAQHHADVFEEVHFVPIWVPGNTVTKADICHQIGANYLIDDSISHCSIAVEGGITSLLFGNRRQHQGDIDSRIVRVATWKAVREYFDNVS